MQVKRSLFTLLSTLVYQCINLIFIYIYIRKRLHEKNINLRIWLNANYIPWVFGSQVRISSFLYQRRRNRKKEKEKEKEGWREERGRDRQAASGLERFRLSGIAAGAGFFYSKCEFLARGIFSLSPPPPSSLPPSSILTLLSLYMRARTRTRARACTCACQRRRSRKRRVGWDGVNSGWFTPAVARRSRHVAPDLVRRRDATTDT